MNKLNSTEILSVLEHVYNTNEKLVEKNQLPISVEIIGEAGIGKTTLVKQFAETHNLEFIKLNLSQLEELSDLVGFPLKMFEITNGNDTRWIMNEEIEQYRSLGYTFTGNKRMSYAEPEWIANKTDKKILLLIDDWTRSQERFIQATMELINEQQYMSWHLPKHTFIVLSANPDDGNYNTSSIDIAQKTRYISFEMEWCAECWARWATHNDIDERCINFILMNPEIVTKNENINARIITMFFKSISTIENFEEDLDMIRLLGNASIGEKVTQNFVMFINNKLDRLISAKDMMESKDALERMVKLTGDYKSEKYRSDIASVLCSRIIDYIIVQVEKGKRVDDAMINRITDFVTNDKCFNYDNKLHMVTTIFNSAPNKFGKLMMNPITFEYLTK